MKLVTLSNRCYAFQGEVESDHVRENAGFVLSERGVVVIDTTRTLVDARWMYHQIRTITEKRIIYVINTHFHADHVFGNQIFDAPKVAHQLCDRRMQSMLSTEWSSEHLTEMARQQSDTEALAGLRITLPEILFDKGLTLEVGDLTLEVMHRGGHTPGSSTVYIPQEEILYISDLLFVGRYPAMMHANCKEWIAALREVERMTAKTVVPGHGSMSTMEDVVRQRSYLEDLRDRVIELVKQGQSKEDVMTHPDFPRYAERAYERSHRGNIGIVYDEVATC